jgi:hypothetical protein
LEDQKVTLVLVRKVMTNREKIVSSCETETSEILSHLHFIAGFSKDTVVNTISEQPYLEKSGWISTIWRTLFRTGSREATFAYVNIWVNKAFDCIEKYHKETDLAKRSRKDKLAHLLLDAIKAIKPGLEGLSDYYVQRDSHYAAKIKAYIKVMEVRIEDVTPQTFSGEMSLESQPVDIRHHKKK